MQQHAITTQTRTQMMVLVRTRRQTMWTAMACALTMQMATVFAMKRKLQAARTLQRATTMRMQRMMMDHVNT